MKQPLKLFVCGSLLALLAACGNEEAKTPEAQADTGENSQGRITLRGELVYRQRIALLPGVTATVALIDTGEKGAKETIITEAALSDFGQVPIAFLLTFPGDAIQPSHVYKLRAALQGPQGNVAWSTVAIDPLDETTVHQISLQQVGSSEPLVYQCDGLNFKVIAGRNTARLALDNRVLELPLVRSASGAKYSDGENVFWSKGQTSALLVLDGKRYPECKAAG